MAHKNEEGFTLFEVMISLAIFSVFMVAYLSGEGGILLDSATMRSEIKLQSFAERKINEIIVSPPELSESLTLAPQTGKFEDDENFSWSVTYKKFVLPDLDKLKGIDGEDSANNDEGSAQEKILYNAVKKNMETLLWQVEVSVKNLTTESSHTVSTWVSNRRAKVTFDGI